MRIAALLTMLVSLTSPALADVQVRFDEGAPKDRFTVTNIGGCALGPTAVTIDLEGSPYGLIFDVTDRGAGVEVFQPFEVSTGDKILKTRPQVRDDNGPTV